MTKGKKKSSSLALLAISGFVMPLVGHSNPMAVSDQMRDERLFSKPLSITDPSKGPRKSSRERAVEMKEQLKDKVRRSAKSESRRRNRQVTTGELPHLYFEPEVCDEFMQFDNPLQQSRDLLTRTVAHVPFEGMDPPESNPEVGETVRTFDAQGNLTRHETRNIARDPDDPPRYLIQCQYDGDNNLIGKTYHYDGRLWDPIYRATYIAPNVPDVETYEADYNNDGVIEWRSTIRNTYNERGKYIRGVSDWDDNADGTIEARSIELVSYDASGLRSRVIGEADDDADGDIDGRYTRFANRGLHGRLESIGEEWDFDFDGVLDLSDVFTHSYDDRGNWIREVHEVDIEGGPDGWADGIPDSRTDTTFLTYDLRGNLTSSSTEYWFAAPFGAPDYYYESFWEYDQHNQMTSYRHIVESYEPNAEIDELWLGTFTYDYHGRLIEFVGQIGGADPAYANVERERFKFDHRGNILAWITNYYPSHRPHEAIGYQGRMEYARQNEGAR